MSELARFGVSIDDELLETFDRMISKKGYGNRSEALRDLIRNAIVEEEWTKEKGECVGTISIVYDHHKRELEDRLTEIQHHSGGQVLCSTHVHLDHDNCLEVIVARGRAKGLKALSDRLIGLKGVKHGKFTMTTTGKNLT